MDANISTIERLPLGQALGIPQDILDHAMATAYRLYREGRHPEAEVMVRGLLSADPTYWWGYSLYAAILRRTGRLVAAIAMLDRGLVHEPGQPKLLKMRNETQAALDAINDLAAKAQRGEIFHQAGSAQQEVA